MPRPTPSLLGKVFGRISVIACLGSRRRKNGSTRIFWLCRCDCGVYMHKPSDGVPRNTHGCQSCKGRKEDALQRTIYGRYKQDAARRGHTFALDFDYFVTICGKNCFYCGSEPCNKAKAARGKRMRKSPADGRIWTYSGIDRLDSRAGYIAGNCVACCIVCNVAKHMMTPGEYVGHCRKVIREQDGYNA